MPSPVTRDRRQFKTASQPAPVEDDQPVAAAPPEEAPPPAPVAQAPTPTGTTGGLVVQQAGTWDKPVTAPTAADPQQRAQQSLQREQEQFSSEQQAKNPFIFSNAIPDLSKVTGARHKERVVAAGDRDYREQQMQQRAAEVQRRREGVTQQKSRNAQLEEQYRSTGQQFYTDPFGDMKPIIEASTGRALYHATPWEGGTHPKTGAPVLQKRDQYGQRQFKTPPIVASPDLTDDQLYYKFGDNDLRPAGKIEDLVNHPNFDIARLAKRTASSRKKAMWKEAIDPLESVAANANVNHEMGQQKALDLQDQISKLNEASDKIDSSVLEEKEGGIMGIGAKPTQRALQAQKQKSQIEGQIESMTGDLVKLNADLKPSGALGRAKRQSALDVAIFKSKALHDNYSDLADERRLILRQQGKSEADDPTLKSILAAQQEYGTQLERGMGASQREDTAHAPVAQAQPTPREVATSPTPPADAPKSVKEKWESATPIERLKMISGKLFGSSQGIATPIEEAPAAIGSEAAGTKGSAFTIPKMDGEGVLPGVINAANKFSSGLTTPENVALMAGGSLASFIAKIAQGTKLAIAAHVAETGANTGFTAQMAKDAVTSGKQAFKVVQDPNATTKDKADAITSAILSSGMTAFAAKGAKEGVKDTVDSVKQVRRANKAVKEEPSPAAKAAEAKRTAAKADSKAAAKPDPKAAAETAVKEMEKNSRAVVAPDDSLDTELKSAKESAEVIEPALKEKENVPPPSKSAAESADAMKEAEQSAADEQKAESDKEARIQSLADELSKGNDATRAAIIGRRKGLTTDQFLHALERVSDIRRGKAKPDEVADTVKSEVDAAANAPINGETPGVENVGRIPPKELEHVADTISTEKAKKTAEAMANVGGDEAHRPDVPEEAPDLRELPQPEKAKESAQAFENQLGSEETLRRSPQGGEKLTEQLAGQGERVTKPRGVAEPIEEAPAPEQTAPKASAPERIGKAAVKFSDGEVRTGDTHAAIVDQIGDKDLRGSDDGFVTDSGRYVSREEAMKIAKENGQTKGEQKGLTAERLEYDRLQAEMKPEKFGTPEYKEAWRKSEEIKNRNKGMPPGEVVGEAKAPELMSPKEAAGFKRQRGGGADILPSMDMMAGKTTVSSRVGENIDHAVEVATAARAGKPVSAEAVDTYGINLPEGYAKKGDLYEQAKPVAVDENAAAPAKEAAVVQPSEPAAKPVAEEESLIARGEAKPRADVEGTRYPEWRARKLTAKDLENDTIRREAGVGDWIVERRVVRTEGKKVEPGEWDPRATGDNRFKAIENTEGSDPDFLTAKSLHPDHATLAERELSAKAAEDAQRKSDAAKQPWEIPRDRFVSNRFDETRSRMNREDSRRGLLTENARRATDSLDTDHYMAVSEAVKRGENVPAEVLADYEDLARKATPAVRGKHADYLAAVDAVPLKGKKEEITLPVSEGDPKKVAAMVYGDWATHKSLGKNELAYTVTHLPSGKSVARVDNLAAAQRIIKALIYSGVDAKTLASDKAAMARAAQATLGVRSGEAPPWFNGAEKVDPADAPAPISADVEKSTPASVEGDKINRKWTAFDKDSGTLGIPREEMPQIKSDNRGALVQFLKARGVEARAGMIDPRKLKPTQAEFSPEKVQAARDHTGSERPLLISGDNHVIDGHHQWMAALDDKSGTPMPVIKLNAPVDRLLAEIKEFPSAQTAEGAKPAAKAAEPTPEAAPRLSDRAIEALKKARISKPGHLYAHTPFTLAWDGAIDTAILAIRAGRSVHDAVKLAIDRFKSKFPDHTDDDLAAVEQAVRDSHSDKPETVERAELSGVRATVANYFKKGEIEKAMTFTRDAVDNHAAVFGREESNSVKLDLQKAFDGKLAESSDALAFAVESGADRAKLAEMRAKLEASTKADPKWKQRALDAIDFADKNLDALKPVVDRYNQITNEQMGREQFAGIDTLKRDNYVMHKQDIDESLGHMFLGAAGEGNSSFRKNRTHDTFADSIAAGVDPKSLNAVDLLQSRVTAGQQMANKRAWVESLKQFKDPISKQPVAVDVTYTKRPDGSQYADAPNGYSVERVGNAEVAVMKGYEGIFGALTDKSWWNKSPIRRMLQKANATGKSLNLLFDTFHLGRLAAWNAATRLNALGALGGGVKAPNPFSHSEGVLTLDHSPQDLVRIAKEDGRSPEQIKQLLENKQKLNMALDTGANFGKISDALHEDVMHNLPVTGTFSKWLFDKYQRGAMSEIWLMEYDRQRAMGGNKTLSDQQVARKVSEEVNTRFGNLGRQGIFKSKTGQDIARLLVLAPQWNEGLVRSEIGGAAGAFKSAVNAATGKGLATSMLTRSLATMVIGQFVANQLINQYTRGKYTWENPEEGMGAKLSAWIPDKVGGGPGFFLHPAGIGAEITHLMTSKYEKTADFRKSLVEAGRSRLSAIARPFATYLLGTDSLGRNIRPADIYKETAKEAVPLPIPTSSVVGAAKTLATGDRSENFPGQFQKQLMATGGLKTDQAPTPGARMSSLATEFNKSKGIQPSGEFYAGDYTDLSTALRVGNKSNVENTIKDLLAKHAAADIAKHFSRQVGAPFTGNTKREPEFIKTLTQEQKDTYRQARRDRLKLREQANAALRAYMAKNKVDGVAEALQAMMASPSNR